MKRVPFSTIVDRALAEFKVPMSYDSAGTRSAGIGLGFENLVVVTNKTYETSGLGVVTKNHVKMQGSHYAEKQTVDFSGYLQTVGFVAFDAKSTQEELFRVKRNQLHQLCYLLRGQRTMGDDGARFFYLVERRTLDDSRGRLAIKRKVYLVEDLEGLRERGKYEFREADLVEVGSFGHLLDYRRKLLSINSRN